MMRFSGVLLAALQFSMLAHATLAVIVPTRDGFVVASDSRVTYMGARCDGISKIYTPRPARTVAVVTGNSVFVQASTSKVSNPCQWLASAPRLLDMNAVVTGFLDHATPDPLSFSLPDLVAGCVQATQSFQQSNPAALRAYAGMAIFSVVVASYDPGTAATTLYSFAVRLTAGGSNGGNIEAARVTQTKVDASSPRSVWVYGDAEWLNRIVYQGPGRRFLNAATLDFLQVHSPQGDVPLELAQAVATNLIQAAARATTANPPPNSIGGEIRLMVVGSNPLPQQLSSPPAS
jgi:hypothetical protein